MAGPQSSSHFVKTLGGVQMPKLIYGTAWKKERTADLVVQAVRAGFRGIDTACQPKHYHEPGVGQALARLSKEDGIRREDLFIQTKFTSLDGQDPASIPYDKNAPLVEQVKQSLAVSLTNLGTSYVDSLVMHSPMKTTASTLEVWKVFEGFVEEGKVKQLGISNCYSLGGFKALYEGASVKPSVLQNRLYEDSGFDKELRAYCKEKGIYYQSFWTLSANPQILKSDKVAIMAKKYDKTPAQMFFAYLVQTGVVTPLTGTTSSLHMEQDLQVLDMAPLSGEETKTFDTFINR